MNFNGDGSGSRDSDSGDVTNTTRVLSSALEDFFSPLVKEGEQQPELIEVTSRYCIEEKIAQGGMGVIYRARDVHLDRVVAIKILREKFRKRKTLFRRFVEEARIASSLLHPGIAQVFECGALYDGRPFYTMKLVDGETLLDLLQQKEASSVRWQALRIFADVCEAMAYTHSRGVLHLDLKPANIMVGAFGEVHVMDWGLAQFANAEGNQSTESPSDENQADEENRNRNQADEENAEEKRDDLIAEQRRSRSVHGTLEYMSPEQSRGKTVDERTDVFCLGAILFHILTGAAPFHGESQRDIYKKVMTCSLGEGLQKLNECGIDPALIRLTKRCLSKAAEDRPENAGEVAAEMASFVESTQQLSESDMNRFFELSLDLFCIAGFDGYFRRINSNFSRVLGYSESDLLSTPFLEFVHEEDKEETINVMSALYKGEPVVRFRNRYRARKGGYLTFEWTAKSLPAENTIFAVARNVT